MCRKEIWSFLKVLDYQQILEELINLRLKCSFLNLAGPSHPQESTSHPIFMHSRPVCLLNMKLKTIFHCSSLPDIQARREDLCSKKDLRARQYMQVAWWHGGCAGTINSKVCLTHCSVCSFAIHYI